MLATYSFLPVVQAFASSAGVDVETRDISLAGRILALFPEHLTEEQRISDDLAELGALATTPEANIIKLPNVSASMPQLKAAIKELQCRASPCPTTPTTRRPTRSATSAPATTRSRAARSTRCCARATPTAAPPPPSRTTPASTRTRWAPGAATAGPHVATMGIDDFRDNEQSVVLGGDDTLTIRHVAADGTTTVLKDGLTVLEGEVVDATVMRVAALDAFLREQIARAKADDVLFSVHLKATMMKVSDPIVFGHVVTRLPPRGLRDLRRRPRRGRAVPQQRARRHPRRPVRPAQRRRDQGRHRPRASPTARAWRWSTPTRASPTCTCRATSSSTPRCRR